MTRPKYAIMNDVDRPDKKHVAQLTEIGYCYMYRRPDGNRSLSSYDGMNPRRPTALEDFGFTISEIDGVAYFKKERESIATYEDGRLRGWQDPIFTDFSYPILGEVRRKRKKKH